MRRRSAAAADAELVRAAWPRCGDPYQRLVAELWARTRRRHREPPVARSPSRPRDGLRRALGWRP